MCVFVRGMGWASSNRMLCVTVGEGDLVAEVGGVVGMVWMGLHWSVLAGGGGSSHAGSGGVVTSERDGECFEYIWLDGRTINNSGKCRAYYAGSCNRGDLEVWRIHDSPRCKMDR